MKVDLAVLKTALIQLLDHVEELRGNTVDVPEDMYWFIPREQLHEPAREPTGLTLGSLEDDWNELSAIGRGDKDPFGYGLVWAASVLRAIGDDPG
jgi:hypothetical protein